jgi:hypothetical protein
MVYEQKSISACRLADRALDLTQVLDHVVELLDRLDANHHDAVVPEFDLFPVLVDGPFAQNLA